MTRERTLAALPEKIASKTAFEISRWSTCLFLGGGGRAIFFEDRPLLEKIGVAACVGVAWATSYVINEFIQNDAAEQNFPVQTWPLHRWLEKKEKS